LNHVGNKMSFVRKCGWGNILDFNLIFTRELVEL
jgi:hypothetical protein